MKIQRAARTLSRPSRLVTVLDGFSPDESQLSAVYEQLKPLPRPGPSGNFFFEVAKLQSNPSEYVEGLRAFFGDAAPFLVDHMLRTLAVCPPVDGREARWLELWLLAHPAPTNKVFLHFDVNDEDQWEADGGASMPMWATVLYLCPEAGLEGGETVFCLDEPPSEALLGRVFEFTDGVDFKHLAREWLAVPPKRNRMVVFHGALAHYVEPVRALAAGQPRMTLLVNVWERLLTNPARLAGFSAISPEELRAISKLSIEQAATFARCVGTLSPEELARLIAYVKR